MSSDQKEKYFCNRCKQKTNHFIRGNHSTNEYDPRDGIGLSRLYLIAECCGCEHVAFIKKSHLSEHYDEYQDPATGKHYREELWDEVIYPPVTYRSAPSWFEDLPDQTLQDISDEIYKSLQTGSHYLATFGSRTLIDRLIVLTVGDKGNFPKGLKALQEGGKLSQHERDTLEPVVNAGNAAAHRGWAPTQDQLMTILDTVEGLIHRLLVLPKMSEELGDAVPDRNGGKTKSEKGFVYAKDKVKAAPKKLRGLYDTLASELMKQGEDVTLHPQKHYIAFRRSRNFASVILYPQKKLVRVYLNLDPGDISLDSEKMRDVRQIGHYGTGNVEITLKSIEDVSEIAPLIAESYKAS